MLIVFFRVNDRVISANGISLEGVDYATAVQVLRDSGQTVSLVVKRRVVLPPTVPVIKYKNFIFCQKPFCSKCLSPFLKAPVAGTTLNSSLEPKNVRVSLSRNKKKEDFGVVLACKIYIKEITSRTVADKDGSLQEGDQISKINGTSIEGLTLKEAR